MLWQILQLCNLLNKVSLGSGNTMSPDHRSFAKSCFGERTFVLTAHCENVGGNSRFD